MWEPPMETVKEPIRKLMESDNFFFFLEKLHLGRERNSNFTYQEIKALNKQNQDIIIKPADKGSKIVITDKTQYLIETSKHLQNPLHYKSLSESLQGETKNMIFIKLYKDKYISHKQKTYLLGPVPPRPRQIYLLPGSLRGDW